MILEYDPDLFGKFAPEEPAVIPPDARGVIDFRTTKELILERQRKEAHWTYRFPEWLKARLQALFFRS
jgi:hypothetical protein